MFMWRSIQFILSILICLSMLSCIHTSDKLEIAERLIETTPDSALHILQKIKINSFTIHSDKAKYALLMSEALDKNDIKVESDSLISIATEYYDENDPARAGYAWLYMARCASNSGNASIQANALLKAQEFAIKATNYKLLGLVYGDKADIYKAQQDFIGSNYYNKLAYQSFKKGHAYRNSIISLLKIGGDFLYLSRYDSVIVYSTLAEKIASDLNDNFLNSTIYKNIGTAYVQKKDYNRALYYYRRVPDTHVAIYDSNKCILLANTFLELGKTDSAAYYLRKVNDFKEMGPYYNKLWQTLYEKQGNTAKALYYAKRVTAVTDSLYKRNLNISFAGMEKKYKYQSLQVSNQRLIIKNKQNNILLLIALFTLSLGVIVFLFWRYKMKNQQFESQRQLLEHEKNLAEKDKENIKLLERQLKMQNILLSNVDQYRKQSVKRPDTFSESKGSISPILNRTFHEELIASMDIEYNDISKRLKDSFPELTEHDILVCCLLIANFDNGMIATILDVRIESINKHRYRLRTKLKLQNSDNLIDYLCFF